MLFRAFLVRALSCLLGFDGDQIILNSKLFTTFSEKIGQTFDFFNFSSVIGKHFSEGNECLYAYERFVSVGKEVNVTNEK